MDKTFTISKRGILFFMALLGFVLTIVLAVIYFNANYNPYAGASFCTSQTNPFIDCDGVAKSVDAQFLGIPLAYWGMLFYLVVMFLLLVDKLQNVKAFKFLEVFKNPLSYISVLGLFSFIISMSLAFISIVVLQKICVLCVATYILNFIIGMIATDFSQGGFGGAIKRSFVDFFDALKIKKYLITFICILIPVIGFLTWTGTSYFFTPQVKNIKTMQKFFEMKTNEYADVAKGNVLGDKDAKVVVYAYSDFMCPYCVTENRMFHKIAQELKNVRIEHVNYPLDNACNKDIPSEFHKGACDMAKFAIAAGNQDRYWEMANILFESKASSPADILEIAKNAGFSTKRLETDANSAATKSELLAQIEKASKAEVGGTPAFSLNGKLYMGLKPYDEIKELLIDAGAQKR